MLLSIGLPAKLALIKAVHLVIEAVALVTLAVFVRVFPVSLEVVVALTALAAQLSDHLLVEEQENLDLLRFKPGLPHELVVSDALAHLLYLVHIQVFTLAVLGIDVDDAVHELALELHSLVHVKVFRHRHAPTQPD